MPKKSLADAAPSKLERRQQETTTETRGLVKPRKKTAQPTSFRLTAMQIERLQRLCDQLGEAAGRPISQTDVIKGLLFMGEKTSKKKLLDAIKNAAFEGI
jgi:hypothetical protein